ncbi:phosphatidylserine decarboxylase [Halobacillus sp. GSS1]|uniref:phosphatidylserine decarboxylase n=1 Tax=Halobacillus sp. GSS1 TaxID=2815919 RepID=UPI001A8C1ACD|nr:phosphatidylserine decarboxylase [Halobacillus sp. GSS1]
MKTYVYRGIIRMFNSKTVGRFIHKLSRSSLSRRLIPLYVKLFEIPTGELNKPLKDFTSLEEFFIRELKEGARPVKGLEEEIVSPVDASVEQFGEVQDKMIQVKGISYSIQDLLRNQEMITRYRNGLFLVLYLSPSDYHRIHSPAQAVVEKQFDLGGKSSPVNKWGLTMGESPISTNYRIITELKLEEGMYMALIKVGAMWVNTIEWTHPHSRLRKGEEVGFFSFGSTVVLLFENGKVKFQPDLKTQRSVKAGEPLAVKSKG